MRRFGLGAVIVLVILVFAAPAMARDWTQQTIPAPSGGGTLTGVSCPSDTFCIAVGTASVGGSFAERYDGTSWTLQSPAAFADASLSDVSCFSDTDCTAVGYAFTQSDGVKSATGPAVEHFNGSTWSTQSTPGSATPYLTGVDCPSASGCFAVGSSPDPDSGTSTSLIEQSNGSSWVVDASPNGSGEVNKLASVSCTSATNCVATGTSSVPDSDSSAALGAHWNGTSWSEVAPTDAAGSLVSVSCPSGTRCLSVGTTGSGSPASATPVAELFNGTTWSETGVPVQSAASVSCSGLDQCTGVGTAGPTGSLSEGPGAEEWNGTSWAADTVAGPGPDGYLAGVSCVASQWCAAVGGSQNPATGAINVPLVEIAQGQPSGGSAPVVTTGAATNVTATTAVLHGNVNPSGEATSCAFAWGASDGVYTHSVPVPCGSGSAPVAVSTKLTGLVAGTSYEYRLSASNTSGTVTGSEERFATPSSGGVSTLGDPSLGDESSTFQSGLERVNPYELYWPGVARSLSIYLQPTSTSGKQSLRLMLYANSGGAPGRLLARTHAFAFASTDPAGWYRARLIRSVDLADGQYWIGVLTGGKANVAGWRYDDTGTRDTRYRSFSQGPTDPFGATGQDTAVTSLFASLTPAGDQSAAMMRRARMARLDGHTRLRIARVRCRRGCITGRPR